MRDFARHAASGPISIAIQGTDAATFTVAGGTYADIKVNEAVTDGNLQKLVSERSGA